MKAQLYTRASGEWQTIRIYRHNDHNAVRDEVLELARSRCVGIGGLRLIIGNKIMAHWNVMQGWVDHHKTAVGPAPDHRELKQGRPLKHPHYSKVDRRKQKTKRECLNCRRLFDSEGPHNRLCFSCARHGDDALTMYRANIPEKR